MTNTQLHHAVCDQLGRAFDFTIRTEAHGDTDVIGEVYTNNGYQLHRLNLPPAPLVFDIGGHIGTFAVLLKQRYPDARVVAIEPNRRSFELLTMNTSGFEGVTLLNAAVSYQGNVVLTDGRGATGGGFLTTQEAFDRAATAKSGMDSFIYSVIDTDVRTLTFEDLLATYGTPDLIKWDCEGGEIDCLRNMSDESAARAQCDMLGEFHIEGGRTAFMELFASRFPNHRLECPGHKHSRPIGPFWAWRA